MAGLGSQSPAPYFARKLLTPALIEGLVDALLPVLADAVGTRPAPTEGLKGKLGSLPLYELLRTLTQCAQSGELCVALASGETRIALRQGEVVAVSSGDALQTEPKRLLLAALQATEPSVSWREVATPGAAERVVSLSDVELDYLRQSPPWLRIAAALPSGALVVERAPGFSQRLAGFELRDDERRVLALVDGKATLDELGQRASMTQRELGAVVYRLVTVGLLRTTRDVQRAESRRPVLVADPDLETFQRPLQRLLAERQRPLELLGLALDEELYGAIVRERPRMVILNVTALGDQARKTALALRAGPDFRDVPLVAVLEAPASELMAELSNAGFDAVLSKPLLFSDLEDLLVA
ncbi:MAG: DUF4388 domain-containing protein [Polyangiaceae bacterium]